jgi:hypothetical protein
VANVWGGDGGDVYPAGEPRSIGEGDGTGSIAKGAEFDRIETHILQKLFELDGVMTDEACLVDSVHKMYPEASASNIRVSIAHLLKSHKRVASNSVGYWILKA